MLHFGIFGWGNASYYYFLPLSLFSPTAGAETLSVHVRGNVRGEVLCLWMWFRCNFPRDRRFRCYWAYESIMASTLGSIVLTFFVRRLKRAAKPRIVLAFWRLSKSFEICLRDHTQESKTIANMDSSRETWGYQNRLALENLFANSKRNYILKKGFRNIPISGSPQWNQP